MADDYLWDRTGSVDPEVAALERALAPLRMPEPLRAPVHPPLGPRLRPARPSDRLGTIATALLTAAATGALIWAWVRSTEPREAIEPAPAISIDRTPHEDAPVSVGTPPSLAAPSATLSNPAPVPPWPAPVASLPETPSAEDIRNGLAPFKERARACGPSHGASPGEKVTVKLSIAGSTGLVTASTPLGGHRGTPLGNCVADALAHAVFPRFAKASIGVQYPITMPE